MDVRMIRFALAEEKLETNVVVAEDGEKAFQYLLGEDPYGNAATPDLLILDLNLPRRNGSEVLRLVRSTERLRDVPVVVLSSSPEDVIRDIVDRAHVKADLLLTKPSDVSEYLALGKVFRQYLEERGSSGGGAAEGT